MRKGTLHFKTPKSPPIFSPLKHTGRASHGDHLLLLTFFSLLQPRQNLLDSRHISLFRFFSLRPIGLSVAQLSLQACRSSSDGRQGCSRGRNRFDFRRRRRRDCESAERRNRCCTGLSFWHAANVLQGTAFFKLISLIFLFFFGFPLILFVKLVFRRQKELWTIRQFPQLRGY